MLILEYSVKYRKSDILKQLRTVYERAKLLPEDKDHGTERIIVCHILKINGTMKKKFGPKRRKMLSLDELQEEHKGDDLSDDSEDNSVDYDEEDDEGVVSEVEDSFFIKTRTQKKNMQTNKSCLH